MYRNFMNGFRTNVLYEDLLDELTGALVGLARVCSNNPKTEKTGTLLLEGLSLLEEKEAGDAIGWLSPEDEKVLALKKLIEEVHEDKYTIAPDCATCKSPCGNTDDYNLNKMRLGDPFMFTRKLQILFVVKKLSGIFKDAERAFPEALTNYILKALYFVAEECSDDQFVNVITEGEGYLASLES